jgi:hypothetical protein
MEVGYISFDHKGTATQTTHVCGNLYKFFFGPGH